MCAFGADPQTMEAAARPNCDSAGNELPEACPKLLLKLGKEVDELKASVVDAEGNEMILVVELQELPLCRRIGTKYAAKKRLAEARGILNERNTVLAKVEAKQRAFSSVVGQSVIEALEKQGKFPEEAVEYVAGLCQTSEADLIMMDNVNPICDSHFDMTMVSQAMPCLTRCKRLYLNAPSQNVNDDESAALLAEGLLAMPWLEHLFLSLGIGDNVAELIVESIPENLSQLVLEPNNIGDKGAFALAQKLPKMTNLRHLKIHGNPIGVAGLTAVAEAMPKNLSDSGNSSLSGPPASPYCP